MVRDPLLYYPSLASTVNGRLARCLLPAATRRRNDRVRRIGIGAALATAVVWPPGRWTDGVAVLAAVTGLGTGPYLVGADRRRVLSAVGIVAPLSIPVFGERFVTP